MSSSVTARAERETSVLVRADAGARLGTGHVMRCLSLADELALRGARVVFATDSPPEVVDRIRSRRHEAVAIDGFGARRVAPSEVWSATEQIDDAEQTQNAAGTAFDLVVVDHYGLSAAWESRFSGQRRVLAIDDLANRPHDVDVVTDQNWYGPDSATRYDHLVRDDTVRLLGPRYAVLHDSYRHVVRSATARCPPRRLLISFGGNDPGGETKKVLDAVSAAPFAALDVDVVVGSASQVDAALNSAVNARARTELHVSVPSLAPLLARADLAIGASGAATWERFATGVPAMVTTVAPHQSGVTAALDADGVTRWLGLVAETEPDTYRNALAEFIERPVTWIPRIVDGFGAARLAESILPSSPAAVRRRRLVPTDVGAMVGLRAEHGLSHEVVHGLLEGPSAWRSEEQWFDRLLDSGTAASAIDASGVPIGLALPGAGEVLIQRCVTSRRVRAAIDALVVSGPPMNGSE